MSTVPEKVRRVSDPLEPELQAVVSCRACGLGIQLRSSGRVGSTLNCELSLNPEPLALTKQFIGK